MAIVSPTLLKKAQEAGIPLRGGGMRTVPVDDELLKEMGLGGALKELSDLVGGRKVTLMFYGSTEALQGRGTMMIFK